MKKVVIYYFSGTGNTWWLSSQLEQKLSNKGYHVACHSVETLDSAEVGAESHDADYIIFGFPVYGSTAPRPMLHFIKQFPKAMTNQKVVVFGTHALASGDTAYHISKMLSQKGYTIKQTLHFTMMTNLHIPKFKLFPPKNDARTYQRHQNILPKLEKVVQAITEDKNILLGNNPFGLLLGSLQRKHVDKLIHTASRDFEVEPTRCIHCNKCVRLCPVQNIEQNKTSYTFKNHCVLCMRCYSQCPTSAIINGKASMDVKKYPRYKGPIPSFDATLLSKHR
jgi:flavodoxin/ferredoxin